MLRVTGRNTFDAQAQARVAGRRRARDQWMARPEVEAGRQEQRELALVRQAVLEGDQEITGAAAAGDLRAACRCLAAAREKRRAAARHQTYAPPTYG